MTEGEVLLPDGRTLSYAELGDPEGRPFIFCHGTPGSRLDFTDDDLLPKVEGLRLILPERPGFGRSSPQPNRTFKGWAEDVEALADHLGLEKFIISGGSGGCPHALAVAAYLPDRVDAAFVFASPAPADFRGATRGMSLGNRLGLWLNGNASRLLARLIESNVRLLKSDPKRYIVALQGQTGPTDAAYLNDPKYRESAIKTLQEAYRQGSAGHVADAKLAMSRKPWSFDLQNIRAPVVIWQGSEDRLVTTEMGVRLQRSIPNARLNIVQGAGHMLLERPEVIEELERELRCHSVRLPDRP